MLLVAAAQGEDRANMVQLRRRTFSTFLRRAWMEHAREQEAKARLLRPKVSSRTGSRERERALRVLGWLACCADCFLQRVCFSPLPRRRREVVAVACKEWAVATSMSWMESNEQRSAGYAGLHTPWGSAVLRSAMARLRRVMASIAGFTRVTARSRSPQGLGR